MSYRPEIKINAQGGTSDFPLDAETVKGVDVVNEKLDVEIVLGGLGGTLTTAQYDKLSNKNCIIRTNPISSMQGNPQLYYKVEETDDSIYFDSDTYVYYRSPDNYVKLMKHRLTITKSTKGWVATSLGMSAIYNTDQTDALLANKQNIIDKEMYHLGVYDTFVDNNDGTVTVTRQTGYVSAEDFNKGELVFNDTAYFISRPAPSGSPVPIANIDFPYRYSWDGDDSHYYYENGNYIFIVLISDLSNLIIQYKLATSYTEKVLKNKPLNTLNQNGSYWLQNEYQKTVNLFTFANYISSRAIRDVSVGHASSSEYAFTNITGSDPYCYQTFGGFEIGKTYTISVYSTQVLQYATIGGNHIITPGTKTGSFTFTASSTSYELGVEFLSGFSACNVKIMLNEGTTALPYVEYGGGAIVHSGELNEIVYNGYNSVNISSGSSGTIHEVILEPYHTYLIISNIDLNVSDSYIMSGTINIFNGSTAIETITARTTASNGGGLSQTYICTAKNYTPTVKITSYNYLGSTVGVRAAVQILKLK